MLLAYFNIRSKLPSLNELVASNREHWSSGARLKKTTEEVILWSIREAERFGRIGKITYPCYICIVWHERTRKRDPDNIFSGKKYILDAMQKSGILDGDGQKYVSGYYDELVIDTYDGASVYVFTGDTGEKIQNTVREIIEEEKKENPHEVD